MPSSSLLVLGGARSGKSHYAQSRAEALGGRLVFVATAQAFDREMIDRIARHRADRDARWMTIEAPLEVAEVIADHSAPDTVLLLDCLTLWASNLVLADRDTEREAHRLGRAIANARGSIIVVSNEVGLGIVPDNVLARRFRDVAGTINKGIAAMTDEVVMMFAGLPMMLKSRSETR